MEGNMGDYWRLWEIMGDYRKLDLCKGVWIVIVEEDIDFFIFL